jgi:putative ATP-binding cassette transporter
MLKDLYRESWPRLLLSVITELLSGVSGAGLIKIIGSGASGDVSLVIVAPSFFVLCIAQVLCKTYSQLALTDRTQEPVCYIRVDLCRKVISTPYRKLESLGNARLLVILTSDINVFMQAAQILPSLFADTILIGVCLCYIAWLSWQIALVFTLILILGTNAYHFAECLPQRELHKLREQVDVMYHHFRSLLEGARELQLNGSRGDYFVREVIDPSVRRIRELFLRAMASYMLVINVGGILFFVVIGLLLFVVPIWFPQPPVVMTTLTFLLLFLIQPIGDIMTALPNMRLAAIAFKRIRQLDAELTLKDETSCYLLPSIHSRVPSTARPC